MLGIAGAREIATAETFFRTRAFRLAFAYLHLGFIPVAVALYIVRPDWMWMYWVDAARIPIVVVALVFALYELCFIAGFAVASALSSRARLTLAAITGACLLAGEVAARDRLLALTPRALTTPHEISFSPLHITTLGWTMLVVIPASTLALVLVAVRIARRPVA